MVITAFQLTFPHGSVKWISERRQSGIDEIWDAPRKKQKRGNGLEVEQKWIIFHFHVYALNAMKECIS